MGCESWNDAVRRSLLRPRKVKVGSVVELIKDEHGEMPVKSTHQRNLERDLISRLNRGEHLVNDLRSNGGA